MIKRIFNLTLHELTEEQVLSLQKRFPEAELDPNPRGVVFPVTEDSEKACWKRAKWVQTVPCALVNIAKNQRIFDGLKPVLAFIVGGDSAATIMMAEELGKSYIMGSRMRREYVLFLASQTERIRDENGRFVFVHKGWMEF